MNGLALQPNSYMAAHVDLEAQRKLLLEHTDMLRVSLAGNLRSIQLEDHTGRQVFGTHDLYPLAANGELCSAQQLSPTFPAP